MVNVALLFTNCGPYHFARLNAAHQLFSKLDWKVTAIELARTEADYEWRTQVENLPYPFITVSQAESLETSSSIKLIKNLYTVLKRTTPDAIAITGYYRPTMLAALLWCLWHRKSPILFSATKEDDVPRKWWQEQIKRWIVGRYSSALVGGKPQKRYLEKLGVASERIAVGYNVVENDVFHPDRISSLPNPVSKPFFFTISRFIPKKNLANLLTAYASYRRKAEAEAFDLVLCGDGQLRPQLEQQIAELALSESVHLPGFLQQNELMSYFAHASCFIHASTKEQWGLVVNEAMAAGLPVLVSNRCGCFEDLVVDGVNGWGFDPDNIEQLTELLLRISSKDCNAEAMGAAALNHIQNFSPAHFAEGLLQAVKHALHH